MPIQIYSYILRILTPKNENFQMKNPGSFHVSAQNIDCGYLLEPPRRGGSNEYLQPMFLNRNKYFFFFFFFFFFLEIFKFYYF